MAKKDFVIKDSWERKEFTTWMVRDTNQWKARFDLCMALGIPYDEQLLTRFAIHMGKWASKYADRNREKAETQEELNRFRESWIRHFMQWFNWLDDEDHAAAVLFNIMWAEYVKYKLGAKTEK